MKKLFICMLLCICTYGALKAQLSDDFSDGNMSDNPAWGGNISKFEVDISQKLHINAPAEASQAYLSTSSNAIGESEWSWYTEINANPSSTNFCKVYLTSDQMALDGPLNGYFVKIGGTTDEVSLYRQQGLTETMIINGSDGRVNLALVQISVKVKRDVAGNWILETKLATEATYFEEGNVFDDTHTSADFFGVYCKYTATRSTAFYFDDIVVSGGPIPDTTAPQLLSHLTSNSKQIKLHFSEPLLISTALQTNNYLLDGFAAENVSYLDDTVFLTFSSPFPNGQTQQLSVSGVADENSNLMTDTLLNVFYFEKVKADWGSVVINEIFPDPTPSLLNLPDDSDAEFVEIYNPGTNPYDLTNWLINDKSLPAYILHPGQHLILCKASYEEIFEVYGNTIGLSSWPTLSNSGGSIVLTADDATIVDSVSYTSTQIAGGVSLERIYVQLPCNGQQNFALSADQNGATPGFQNTAFSDEVDLSSPELLEIISLSGDSLMISFSEKAYLPQPYLAQIIVNDTISPKVVSYVGLDSTKLLFVFDNPLTSHTHHQLSIREAYDCNGNTNENIKQTFYLDLQAPLVEHIVVLDTAEILVKFSENLLKSSAEEESNYLNIIAGENPKKALLGNDSLSVLLTFSSTLNIQDTVWLSIQALEDLNKNSIPAGYPLLSSFVYHSQIDTVHVINEYQLDIHFKITPDAASSLNALHYAMDRSIGNPVRVVINEKNPNIVHLLLQNALSPNKKHTLTVSNLLDEKSQLISTPLHHFNYDIRGPLITEVKTIDAKEFIILFDEDIQVKTGEKLRVWINKDTVAIERYELHEKHIRIKLTHALEQENNYVISVEGLSDLQSHLSNSAQNFPFLLDQLPPRLDSAFLYSPYELMLVFHEPVLIEEMTAENYFRLIQPAYFPLKMTFHQLSPEKVLFSFEETFHTTSIEFQIDHFSDLQQNRITSPLDYQVDTPQPSIGHIVPLANNHLRLHFTSDIQNLGLQKENFSINNDHLVDSLSFYSAHELDIRFDQAFFESVKYKLNISHPDLKQSIDFVFQDFVESVSHDGNSTVKIQFSVPLEISSAENIEHYTIEAYGHPLAAVYIPEVQTVQLLFNSEIDREILQEISIQNLLNIDHFPLPGSVHFFGMGRAPAYQELLISEIMVKPSPSVALPSVEYVEVYNASNFPLQLKGLKLADAQKTVSLTEKWLSPGEYLILCSTSAVESLSAFGSCMGISGFPSLNDDTDTLSLLNASEHEIHSVSYSESWYNDASKNNGGWSLEMIDLDWPCQGMNNWRASVAPLGGTPGKTNSVRQSNPDLQAPVLLQAVAEDSLHLLLTFSENLDKGALQKARLDLEGIPIINFILVEEHQLQLALSAPLQAGLNYTLSISHVADCSGNLQEEEKILTILLPDHHQRNDILVSEILFHTRAGGVDFVELYNNTDKYLNLKNWKLATQLNEQISSLSLISAETYILGPGEYLAITKNKKTLTADYPHAVKGKLFESKAFPSLLSDGGTLLLIDNKDQIMQEINFSPDWHHPLLQEPRGVSLERISWNTEENNHQYWQSAASSVGYATPGYQNSQWQNLLQATHSLQIDPPLFYPDQSGYLDYTRIHFKLDGVGNIGSLKIFDARGKMIRQLAQNQSLSEEGFFTWDGTDDFKKRAHIGYYIIWMEVFRPDGSVNILKSKVVVASKF